jgi:hypothetical protein
MAPTVSVVSAPPWLTSTVNLPGMPSVLVTVAPVLTVIAGSPSTAAISAPMSFSWGSR